MAISLNERKEKTSKCISQRNKYKYCIQKIVAHAHTRAHTHTVTNPKRHWHHLWSRALQTHCRGLNNGSRQYQDLIPESVNVALQGKGVFAEAIKLRTLRESQIILDYLCGPPLHSPQCS